MVRSEHFLLRWSCLTSNLGFRGVVGFVPRDFYPPLWVGERIQCQNQY